MTPPGTMNTGYTQLNTLPSFSTPEVWGYQGNNYDNSMFTPSYTFSSTNQQPPYSYPMLTSPSLGVQDTMFGNNVSGLKTEFSRPVKDYPTLSFMKNVDFSIPSNGLLDKSTELQPPLPPVSTITGSSVPKLECESEEETEDLERIKDKDLPLRLPSFLS